MCSDGDGVRADPTINMLTDSQAAMDAIGCANYKCPAVSTDELSHVPHTAASLPTPHLHPVPRALTHA